MSGGKLWFPGQTAKEIVQNLLHKTTMVAPGLHVPCGSAVKLVGREWEWCNKAIRYNDVIPNVYNEYLSCDIVRLYNCYIDNVRKMKTCKAVWFMCRH